VLVQLAGIARPRGMCGKLVCFALVCNFVADARQALSDSCPNQPPPYVLLQTQAKQAHGNNMPAEYFEDPVSNSPHKEQVTNPAAAPFDVGSGSVRLPAGYQAATKVGRQQPRDQAAMALVDVGAKARKAKKKREKAVENFDEEEEDAEGEAEERQEFSGLSADAEPQPTLLEQQDAKQRLLEKQQQQADAGIAEQAADAAFREQALVQQQAPAEAAQEAAAGEHRREEQPLVDEATSAADFVAAQGDFAGQEPGTPGSGRPQASGEQIWSLPPHRGQQPEARPESVQSPATRAARAPPAVPRAEPVAAIQQASRTEVASASTRGSFPHLDILKDDGKPDSGQTGEEGEQVLAPPTSRKFSFRNKNQADLDQERELRKEQKQIAQRQEDAREALNALKAKVYESASFTDYRLNKQGSLQTDLRRAQLLADANQYKAHQARKSRKKVEEQAGRERALHLSEAALAEEKDATMRAETEQGRDIARMQEVFEDQAKKSKLNREQAEEKSFNAILKATKELLSTDQEVDSDINQQRGQAIPASHLPKANKNISIVMRPASHTEANPLLDDYVKRYVYRGKHVAPNESSMHGDAIGSSDEGSSKMALYGDGMAPLAAGWQTQQDAQRDMFPRAQGKLKRKSRRGAGPSGTQQVVGWQEEMNPQDEPLSRAQAPSNGNFPAGAGPSDVEQAADWQAEMNPQDEMLSRAQALSNGNSRVGDDLPNIEQAADWRAEHASEAEMPLRAPALGVGAGPSEGQQQAGWQVEQGSSEIPSRKHAKRQSAADWQEVVNSQDEPVGVGLPGAQPAGMNSDEEMLSRAQENFPVEVGPSSTQQEPSWQAEKNSQARQISQRNSAQTKRPQLEHLGPGHGQCTPSCTWQCTNPRCEQDCKPECEPPKCQTRCNRMNTKGCVMECVKPHCAVVCPKNLCNKPGCPTCINTCSKPMCKLQCPREQPCVNVCEAPKCEFKCKAPESCPKPTCKLVCETARSCKGYVYHTLPPLQQNESLVQSFATPSNLRRPADFSGSFLRGQAPAEVGHTSPMVDVSVLSMERPATEEPSDLRSVWQPQQRTVSLPAL